MRAYSRIPAILILCLAAAVGGGYVYAARHRALGAAMSLPELERAVSSSGASPRTWLRYGDALRAAGRYAHAAAAYRKVMEDSGGEYVRPARTGCALALAQAREADALLGLLQDFVVGDPKLTLELLEHPLCHPYLDDPRFTALQKDARMQAMD